MSKPHAVLAGRYRLERLIATGGMGVVWEAWDELLERPVAVKQLRTEVGVPEDEAELAKNRAMREARITARLHHPHAVPVFDAIEHEGRPCLIMQFVPSRPLSEIVRDDGPLSPHDAARIGTEIASALAAAHKLGIVHRDVKPGNILITEDGSAMISDFGISHALGDATLTSTGLVHGTPAYLAPEVARGAESGFSSDVFSLGSTLYAAVEGQPPFGMDNNSIALLHKVASGDFAPPVHGGVLSSLILQMLAADPQARPDMKKVAKRLAVLERESEKTALLPVPAPAAAAPPVEPDLPAATAILPAVLDEPVEAPAPAQEMPAEQVADQDVADEELPGEELPEETLSDEELLADEVPPEELPAEDVAEEDLPEEQLSEEDLPEEDLPEEQLPLEEPPAEELSADEVNGPDGDTAALGATQAMTGPTPATVPTPPAAAPTAAAPRAAAAVPVAASTLPAAAALSVAASATPAPLPAPTQPPAAPYRGDAGRGDGGGEPPRDRSRRGRVVGALVLLAVLVLAAVLVTSLVRGQLGQSSGAQPGSTSGTRASESPKPADTPSGTPSASAEAEPEPSSAAPVDPAPSADPDPEPAPAPPADEDGEAPSVDSEDDLAAAIEDYYNLMPDDTDAAWPLMTAGYQENHAGGRDAYEEFWAPVDEVDAEDVTATAPGEAQATIVYTYDDGSVTEEVTSYELVEEDGVLKIADSTVISSVDR